MQGQGVEEQVRLLRLAHEMAGVKPARELGWTEAAEKAEMGK